jgi:fused signal recognition particle receptor
MNTRLEKWKAGLERTRKTTFGKIATILGTSQITGDTWDDLEAILIQADLGLDTTQSIILNLKSMADQEGWIKSDELKSGLQEELRGRLTPPPEFSFQRDNPTVIMIVGVNGSGKTTSVAKLGKRFQNSGKKVLLAATDTFRAAGIEQLQRWGEHLGLRVITGQPEGDPGAVTYDAVQSAVARKEDILLIDTAGRLHTRYNLMEELKKVYRVAAKSLPGAPHAVWLVMDATTGQNALQQARAFKETVNVTGVILAKLDSSARGGMAFAIQQELGLPILFAGLGEGPEDLALFDPDAFIDSILFDLN